MQPDLFDVVGANVEARTAVQRLTTDWIRLPSLARHYSTTHCPSFPPTLATRRNAKRLIYTLHDLTWWRFPEYSSTGGRLYYRRIARKAAYEVDILVVDSDAVREEAIATFGLDDSCVITIYPGVSSPTKVDSFRSGRPYVLVVGTLEPRKNLHRLVSGFALSGLAHDFDLVVVGRVGWGVVPEHLSILSSVSDSQLWSLYAGASLVAVPSLYEGFGLPVVEAFAVGTPVACSDIPVFREVTQGAATYFDPFSADSIGEGLVSALRSPVSDVVCRKRIAAGFSWDVAASKLIGLYRS